LLGKAKFKGNNEIISETNQNREEEVFDELSNKNVTTGAEGVVKKRGLS
jgi:hypothetical protein